MVNSLILIGVNQLIFLEKIFKVKMNFILTINIF